MYYKKFVALFLSGIILVSCGAPSHSDIAKNKISEFLKDHAEMSIIYDIEVGGKNVASGAQGLSDRSSGTKLDLNSNVPIASATKTITAALILKLQEKGMLTIYDKLTKFFEEDSEWWPNGKAPSWAHDITIHHLLSNTSGLDEYVFSMKIDPSMGLEGAKKFAFAQIAKSDLSIIPGEKYIYTNSNYFLLGLIAEKVTGKELGELYKEEFFTPLGMENTHLASFEEATNYQRGALETLPRPYFAVTTDAGITYVDAKADFFFIPFSDGGIVSTVKDMMIWNKALHQGKILSEFSYKIMTTPYNEIPDRLCEKSYYGYGIKISDFGNGTIMYFHPGVFMGIRSEQGYIPTANIYFAALSNVMVQRSVTNELTDNKDNQILKLDIEFFRKSMADLAQEIISPQHQKP
ncbi:MAG: serine hydrolase domain-containing protein [Rickettsiaceae bacterium]|nr:serine hydrolase domain-containing protein [Rickettsiaceae bacterium]